VQALSQAQVASLEEHVVRGNGLSMAAVMRLPLFTFMGMSGVAARGGSRGGECCPVMVCLRREAARLAVVCSWRVAAE
jgi:hypothetical protein